MSSPYRRFLGKPATRTGRFAVAALIATAVWAGMTTEHAHACSCTAALSPTDAFNAADAVFVGTVLAIVEPGAVPDDVPANVVVRSSHVQVVFDVSAVHKGEVYAPQVVGTGVSGDPCALTFQSGDEVVVFADEPGEGVFGFEANELASDFCVVDPPVDAAALAEEFGEGRDAVAPPTTRAPFEDLLVDDTRDVIYTNSRFDRIRRSLPLWGVIVAVMMLGAIIGALRRRGR